MSDRLRLAILGCFGLNKLKQQWHRLYTKIMQQAQIWDPVLMSSLSELVIIQVYLVEEEEIEIQLMEDSRIFFQCTRRNNFLVVRQMGEITPKGAVCFKQFPTFSTSTKKSP